MAGVERSAYDVLRGIGSRDELVRTMLFPPSSNGGRGYEQGVWDTVVQKLTKANKAIHTDLVKILSRASDKDSHRPGIEETLGAQAVAFIYEDASAQLMPESFDSRPETARRIEHVWENRKQFLGSYAYVSGVPSSLDIEPELECPVCYNATTDCKVAPCGHYICSDCSQLIEEMCPVCRQNCPRGAWGRLQAVRDRVVTGAEVHTTSAKLEKLKSIIDGLGETGRALVVAPLKDMLGDVAEEMAKMDVTLAVLSSGATTAIQGTLSRWQRGDAKGLLSHPEIPALNLSEANAVVFLSPILTDTEFIQATGRVVRQGSEAARRGEAVKVIILAANDTIETADLNRIERFQRIARNISQGNIDNSDVDVDSPSSDENGPDSQRLGIV